MAEDFSRHIAVKSSVQDLLSGEYIKGEDGQADYILNKQNEKVFRLNIVGIIVSSSKTGSITNFLLDDGSERIVLRFFEEQDFLEKIELGDTMLCIGKLRMYANERYVAPEICKKVDPLWLKVRNVSLGKRKVVVKEAKKESEPLEKQSSADKVKNTEEINMENITAEVKFTSADKIDEAKKEENEEEVFAEFEGEQEKPLSQKVLELIKKLDSGEGVFIDDLIEKIGNKDVEKIIERMLETGDVFQNLPGRVKIL